jgi:hypothetical protein
VTRGDGGRRGRQAAGFEWRRRAKRGSKREDPAWSGPCGPQQIKRMCFMGLVRECGPLAILMGFEVWAASGQGYRRAGRGFLRWRCLSVSNRVSTRKQRGFAAPYIEFGPVFGHVLMECSSICTGYLIELETH